MTQKKLIVPLIHLNGTGEEMLEGDLDAAATCLQKAIDAMRNVTPNGRDYYLHATGPWTDTPVNIAQDQHRERVAKLVAVSDELSAIRCGIQDRVESIEVE